MRLRHLMVTVVAFWMIGALIPTQASASGFQLRLDKVTATTNEGLVVYDAVDNAGLAGGDEDPAAGSIQVNLFNVSLTTGISHQEVGLPALLSVDAFLAHSDGAATIRLTLEDTGYPTPGGAFAISQTLKSLLAINPGGTGNVGVSVRTYAAASYVPGLGANQPVFGDITTNPAENIAPIGYFQMVTTDLSNPFGEVNLSFQPTLNLFTEITLTFGALGGNINFTQTSTLVDNPNGELPGEGTPEPASLMLISTGIFGRAGAARRRYKLTRG